ncbi:flippase [Aliivibrio fischeri]|uniref:flippase n=1 Tax=Aliivibrio fischeri TaxID=668 RepID=UPI001F20C58D|nr:flippase [Aliivibrio fischeri]MCE7556845.1 flippase [Aliivibrio fischeri]MCE7563303.1 flippase [Aliivibrio fischeri]MCE7570276.1 flippase [Aliivibrio fischeri]
MIKSKDLTLNSLWFALSKLNTLLSGVVFFVILTRYIDKGVVGAFTYAQSIIAISAVFVSFGLSTSIVKQFSETPLNIKNIIRSVIAFQMIVAFVAIVFLYLNFHENNLIVIILSFTLLFKCSEVFKTFFDYNLSSKKYYKAELLILVLTTIFKIIVLLYTGDIIFVCVIILLESMVIFLIMLRMFNKNVSMYNNSVKVNFKEILRDAFPVLISSSIFIIYSRVDQLMVYNMSGDESQALYASAVKLSEGWYFIPLGVVTSYYSILANNKNDDNYFNYFSDACLKVNSITIPAAILITLFSKQLISILYGESYIESAAILTIHVWNGVIIGLSSLTFRHFIIAGYRKLSIYRALIGLLLNIVLNFILIKQFGVIGAAISTLISQFIALFLSNLIWKTTRNIFLIQLKSLFFIKYRVSNEICTSRQ